MSRISLAEGSRPDDDDVIVLDDPTPPPPTSASHPAEIVETKHHEIPRDWTMSTSNMSTSTDELLDNFVSEAVSHLHVSTFSSYIILMHHYSYSPTVLFFIYILQFMSTQKS